MPSIFKLNNALMDVGLTSVVHILELEDAFTIATPIALYTVGRKAMFAVFRTATFVTRNLSLSHEISSENQVS